MAFPLIPIAIFALIAAVAGGGKKKRRVTPPAPGPDNGNGNGNGDEGEIYAFTLTDFPPGGPEDGSLEIDVLPGDMIRFSFEEPPQPAAWQMVNWEVAAGSPVLVIEEDRVVPSPNDPEGTPGQYIVDVAVQPGSGSIAMNFVYVETGVPNPAEMLAKQAIINVV